MEKYLIIAAGGKGERLSDKLPKQFMEINGRPLLMHTIDAFTDMRLSQIILVLNRHYTSYWEELCSRHQFKIPHKVVEGGPARYHSVKSGLAVIPNNTLVAIHDGVRPFVSGEMIRKGFEIALRKGNAIPAVPVTDSIREVSGPLNKPVDRHRFMLIQTPQFFYSTALKKAYLQPYNEKFTDDAMVFEASGQQIYLFEGASGNIKITKSEDFAYAEYILWKRKW